MTPKVTKGSTVKEGHWLDRTDQVPYENLPAYQLSQPGNGQPRLPTTASSKITAPPPKKG